MARVAQEVLQGHVPEGRGGVTRPLYATAADAPRGPEGNAGLWFDKFCNEWRVSGSSWSMTADDGDGPKLRWIRSLADGSGVGARTQLDESAVRLTRLVASRGGQSAVFVTESRFVTGLGRSHPVENGFAWHPVLGTPYLPGSSVKGLVRAWAREHAELRPDIQLVTRVFGEGGQAGSVTFLDAVPVLPVAVEADVMTPHYAGWSADDPPGDWSSPTPIPFLVTAAGTRFLYGLIPCAPAHAGDVGTALGWLESALAWAGAGAKTAVGYGRMARDQSATAQLTERVHRKQEELEAQRREEARMASLSPLDHELEAISREDPSLSAYLPWLKAVEKGTWKELSETERLVLGRIKAEMESAGKWKPTSAKKRPDKDADHQRTLRVIELLKRHPDQR